ncbi:MAG: metallophosphoesterase [Candidatus Aenigmarchaeota archaeon]|nr:metallophosphoesterase [Candidatus Aenigmarchaeota archaeon]
MGIKLLTNYPVVFIPDEKVLVISDTHIGVEYDLSKSGIRIHKQIEKFKDMLDKLIGVTGAKKLVILGDVKHKVPGASIQELKDIPKFLDYLSAKVKVFITKGNHDDYIESIVPKNVKVYGSGGFKIKKYGFLHGHAWPSKNIIECEYLFMGHMQYISRQLVLLKGKLNKDEIKKKYKVKRTGKLNVVILPAFNQFVGSMNVMKKYSKGPFSNEVLNMDKMRVYLLDGTYLGILKDIKK